MISARLRPSRGAACRPVASRVLVLLVAMILAPLSLGKLSSARAQELVANGTFENGSGFSATGSTASSTSAPFFAVRASASDTAIFCGGNTSPGFSVPISGTHSLVLTQTGTSQGYAFQAISIPADARGNLTLAYRAYVQGSLPNVDRVRFDIVTPGTEADPSSSLRQLLYFTTGSGVQSGTVSVDISAYAGQTISLRAFARGETNPANLAIDNVSVLLSPESRGKTAEIISQFMRRRADLLMSNGPNGHRQIDRLLQASRDKQDAATTGGAGFARVGPDTWNPRAAHAGFSVGPTATGFGTPAADGMFGGGTHTMSGYHPSSALGRLHDGRVVEGTGLSPLFLSGSNDGATRVSFSTSLSQMMHFKANMGSRGSGKALDAAGLAPSTMPGVHIDQSPFDVWVEGHFANFSDDHNSRGDSNGHFGVLYLGADYILSPSFLVGVVAQYDSMNQSSRTGAFDIEGQGWMAGPYATVRLSSHIFLQARAAWGRSDNEVSPYLTYTDSFSSERWLVTSRLVGRWDYESWSVRPAAEIAYIEDRSEAYIDSQGTRIPGLSISLGQFKVGPQVSRRYQFENGTAIEPRVGLEAIWNFESSDDVARFGGTLAGPEEVRGRVELGVGARAVDGILFDLSGSYDGIGSRSYYAYTVGAAVRIPLD